MTRSSSAMTDGAGVQRRAAKRVSTGRASLSGKQPASAVAQRRAAAILEVLAGVCTPPEAAAVLSLSVNSYYLLERKALAGLTAACEPKPKGRVGPGPEQHLAAQAREVERLRRECQRQAALVRATQRAVGLPAAAPSKTASQTTAAGGKRKRRRRAAVRALRAADSLRKTAEASAAAEGNPPGIAGAIPEEPAAQGPDREGKSSQLSLTAEHR